MIQCDIKERKPVIVVVNKNERSCAIIDSAIPGDSKLVKRRWKKKREIPGTKESNQKNMELKRVIKRIWNIRSIKVIPVVEGTLGSTSKKLKNCIELGVVISTALRQEIALLRTARILRKVLRLQIRFVETGAE